MSVCVLLCLHVSVSHQWLCVNSLWLWPAVRPPLSKTTEDCLCTVEIYHGSLYYLCEPQFVTCVYSVYINSCAI